MAKQCVRDSHLAHSVKLRNATTLSVEDSKAFIDYVKQYFPHFSKAAYSALVKNTPVNKVKKEVTVQSALFQQIPFFLTLLEQHSRVFINLLYFRLLKKMLLPKQYRVVFSDSSKVSSVSINRITLSDDQKLLRIRGIIKTCTSTFPVLREAYYRCANCKHVTTVINPYFERLTPACSNRCKYSAMQLDEEKSLYIDVRKIELQELQQNLEPGEQPRMLCGFIETLSTITLVPGKEHTVTGLLLKYLPDKTPFSLQYMDIFEVDHDVKTAKKSFSKEQINSFEEYAQVHKNSLCQELGNAIFTGLLLPKAIKHTLVLQLCGGVVDRRGRSDIHVLLVGDPGSGKSQILKTVTKFGSAIFASGVTSSGPGLTAAVTKDSVIPGRWGVEVGAFVFADKGLIALDEIDKVKGADLSTLHEAMEQQTITIAKAGILMTLNSRCAVLAAANPQFGHFVSNIPLEKQLTVPATILNRFDVVFFMKDQHSTAHDEQLVTAILTRVDAEQSNWAFLRRYIQYVQMLKPTFTRVAQQKVKEFYARLRNTSKIAVTARQLQAIVRLAEAAAKLRCANYVIGRDVEIVSQLIQASLQSHTELNTFKELGISQKKSTLVTQLYRSICKRKSVTHSELAKEYQAADLEQAISILLSRTLIYQPHNQVYEPV